MRAERIIAIVFGILLMWYVSNGFIRLMYPQFHIPVEDLTRGTAGYEFVTATQGTGYLFWLIKGLTVIVGGMLLLNVFVPLALAVYTPIAVNHVLFSAFLNPQGLIISGLFMVMLLILLWQHRQQYLPILTIR